MLRQVCVLVFSLVAWLSLTGSPCAAQRRRQRRLRSWWRHEQHSIAAALATSQHHSALRGQKKARAGEGFRVELYGEDLEASPSPGGRRRVLSDGRGSCACRWGLPTVCSTCLDRRSGSAARSMFLCRWWENSWWTSSVSSIRCLLLPSR